MKTSSMLLASRDQRSCPDLGYHLARLVSRQNVTGQPAVSEDLSFRFWKAALASKPCLDLYFEGNTLDLMDLLIQYVYTGIRKVLFSTKLEFLTDWDFRLIVLLHQETVFLMKDMHDCKSWGWIQRAQKSFCDVCLPLSEEELFFGRNCPSLCSGSTAGSSLE